MSDNDLYQVLGSVAVAGTSVNEGDVILSKATIRRNRQKHRDIGGGEIMADCAEKANDMVLKNTLGRKDDGRLQT